MGSTQGSFTPADRKKFFLLVLSVAVTLYLLIWSNQAYRPFEHDPQTYMAGSSDTPSNDNNNITTNPTPIPITTPIPSRAKSPYCVAAFLGADYHGEDGDDDDADWYFVGARTLVYQLLHSPTTRFTNPIDTEPIPVVILVTKDVRESKRKRLEADGAKVVLIEEIAAEFDIGNPRYAQVLTKLRLFNPDTMPYEKVFLMDTDMVITRPLDGIFHDASSNLTAVDPSHAGVDSELATMPEKFMFAAAPESPSRDHEFPYLDPERKSHYFNVGCMLFSPSKEIYDYYLSILKHPDLFGHGWPEQDLLNYIHRLDGPMPWGRLDPTWYLSWPNKNDMEGKMAIIHAKFWSDRESELPRRFAISRVWEMHGYWLGRESL